MQNSAHSHITAARILFLFAANPVDYDHPTCSECDGLDEVWEAREGNLVVGWQGLWRLLRRLWIRDRSRLGSLQPAGTKINTPTETTSCNLDAIIVAVAVHVVRLPVTVSWHHTTTRPRRIAEHSLVADYSRHLLQLGRLVSNMPEYRRVGILQGRDDAGEAGQSQKNPYSHRQFIESTGHLILAVTSNRFPSCTPRQNYCMH